MNDDKIYGRVDDLMQQGMDYWSAYDQAVAEQETSKTAEYPVLQYGRD